MYLVELSYFTHLKAPLRGWPSQADIDITSDITSSPGHPWWDPTWVGENGEAAPQTLHGGTHHLWVRFAPGTPRWDRRHIHGPVFDQETNGFLDFMGIHGSFIGNSWTYHGIKKWLATFQSTSNGAFIAGGYSVLCDVEWPEIPSTSENTLLVREFPIIVE